MHAGAVMSSGHPKTTQVLLKLSFYFVVKFSLVLDISGAPFF